MNSLLPNVSKPMKKRTATTPLQPGQVVFYDNCVPGLEAGDYVINVAQEINPNTTPSIDETHIASQGFSIKAPRYALPAGDIYSVFPPEDAQGVFEQSLPHVVFSKRDLPWEIDVFGNSGTAGSTQTPWLALLLFVENEPGGLLKPAVQNRTLTTTVTADQFYPGGLQSGILWPQLGQPEWYETPAYLKATPVNVIDVDPAAFTNLLPTVPELLYLAHARQVDPSAKDSQVLQINGDGYFSVVVGNRLPDAPPSTGGAGQRNIAHLVSLEGFNGVLQPGSVPSGTTAVRMISLKSWSFQCLPEMGESFKELMTGLTKDATGQPKSTVFSLPLNGTSTSSEAAYVTLTLELGFVPLRYQTRLGEETLAWYRGPFSPAPIANFLDTLHSDDPTLAKGWNPFTSASAAMILTKDTGLFNASYAVAFETGRLLALADGSFGRGLLEWERKGHALIDMVLERQAQYPALKNFNIETDSTQENAVLSMTQPYAFTDDFVTYLVGQLGTQLATPSANTPPPPAVPFPPFGTGPTVVPTPASIADLMTQPLIQDAVQAAGGAHLEALADWLAQRYLLIGVPFETLVPSAGLLPPESVRFFYLDSNWLDSLLEGALSIGIESSRDVLYQDLMKDLIWNAALNAVQQQRDKLLDPAGTTGPSPLDKEAMTGMLLRSAVVSGWPGMQITAFSDAAGNNLLPPLRMERLADDVLLLLWPAVPASVSIAEPHEGIAFGFTDVGNATGLKLRSLNPATYGQETGNSLTLTSDIVDATTGRLHIDALTSAIAAQVSKSPLAVRDFAVEMIKVPEQALFTPTTTGRLS
jgi:hypothetical protein